MVLAAFRFCIALFLVASSVTTALKGASRNDDQDASTTAQVPLFRLYDSELRFLQTAPTAPTAPSAPTAPTAPSAPAAPTAPTVAPTKVPTKAPTKAPTLPPGTCPPKDKCNFLLLPGTQVHKYRDGGVFCIEGCILNFREFFIVERGWKCGKCPKGARNKRTKSPTTRRPTRAPVVKPTKAPVTPAPTKVPTKRPTKRPTKQPTKRPTKNPTQMPSAMPSRETRIVISEIMINPDPTSDLDTEWIELYNAGTGDVNLLGWKVEDNIDNWTIDRSITMRPGAYITLVSSRNSATPNRGFLPTYVLKDLALNNVKDSVTIKMPPSQGNAVEDVVAWDANNGWTIPVSASLALRDVTLPNDVPANFCTSGGTAFAGINKGSPGAANSCGGLGR